ncbi:hypothetical protein ABC762_04035 [Staphylococcus ureilyticus]
MFTLNSQEEVKEMKKMGVDGDLIITHR